MNSFCVHSHLHNPMADKKNRKFLTSILIGGALGSMAALVFGKKKKEEKKSCALGELFKKKDD